MSATDFDGVRWKQFAAIQDGGFGVGFPFSAARDPHNRAANCYVGRLNNDAAYKHDAFNNLSENIRNAHHLLKNEPNAFRSLHNNDKIAKSSNLKIKDQTYHI